VQPATKIEEGGRVGSDSAGHGRLMPTTFIKAIVSDAWRRMKKMTTEPIHPRPLHVPVIERGRERPALRSPFLRILGLERAL
jgi:hypothetical protein